MLIELTRADATTILVNPRFIVFALAIEQDGASRTLLTLECPRQPNLAVRETLSDIYNLVNPQTPESV